MHLLSIMFLCVDFPCAYDGRRPKKVDVIYLNFAKAFGSVNHRFFLAKMMPFGLGDVVVLWIEAYLSRRVSRVPVGGER